MLISSSNLAILIPSLYTERCCSDTIIKDDLKINETIKALPPTSVPDLVVETRLVCNSHLFEW